MIHGRSVLAIIPARIGSKRLPKKNILPLLGKPLISWTIESALASKYIDECIVSTDSNDIANIAKDSGAKIPFLRPSELATDDSSSVSVYIHALQSIRFKFDIVVFLQPTSPLRLYTDIDNALERMMELNAPSIVSVRESEYPKEWFMAINEASGTFKTFDRIINSQDYGSSRFIYSFNGAIKAIYVENFLKDKYFFSNETVTYIMPKSRSIDIDTEFDFMLAEFLLRK